MGRVQLYVYNCVYSSCFSSTKFSSKSRVRHAASPDKLRFDCLSGY
jgi:hypothetical protein